MLLIGLRRVGLTGGWPTQSERIFYVHHGSILTAVAVEGVLDPLELAGLVVALEGGRLQLLPGPAGPDLSQDHTDLTTPLPCTLRHNHHSTALPFPNRYDSRYEEES